VSTKKDRLISNIAQLLTQHSSEDWFYIAEHLEDVAQIARNLATVANAPDLKISRKTAKEKPKARTKQPKQLHERSFSPDVMAFRKNLENLKPQPSNEILRKIAIEIGIKSDVPKTKSGIVEEICKFLDVLPEDEKLTKLNLALHLSQKVTDQTEDFARWVSLITKRES